MSDGLGFGFIAESFLEKVAGNERFSRDLPRRRRDTEHGPRHQGAAGNEHPVESAAAQGDSTTPHIDVRI